MKNLRASRFYKQLDSYKAIAYAEGFCEGEGASEYEQLCAWQYLVDKRLTGQLQGWFGRTAQSLIHSGHIRPPK
jgi:hypothetical protein